MTLSNTSVKAGAGRGDIAICGIGLRLPGGIRHCPDFWKVLIEGIDTGGPVPSNRWNAQGFSDELHGRLETSIRRGHFLDEDIFGIDPYAFSITRDDAESIDPQQKLLLEVVGECLDDARETDYRGKAVGCFVGSFSDDWYLRAFRDTQDDRHATVHGKEGFFLSNRVSYEYDLRGPSLVVRTACSSCLVALHQACRSIRAGDATSAIVAGCNLILTPESSFSAVQAGLLSLTGSCKTFDAAADGYARGEAVNAIFIKPLEQALADGNPIRAILKATAVNSDGGSSSILVPSSEAHEALIRKAYQEADLDPRRTALFECHGTGTQTGDVIETQAIGNIFGTGGVLIGSVKPGLGHSEAASGLTSLIKAVLALEHGTIPPNIRLREPNPKGPSSSNVGPATPKQWLIDRGARVSVSSLGVGGTNAHAIVESVHQTGNTEDQYEDPQFIVPRGGQDSHGENLVLFSAHSEASLARVIQLHREWLVGGRSHQVSDVASTLALHRTHRRHRSFAVVDNKGQTLSEGVLRLSKDSPSVLVVFNGQGAQWGGMGKRLVESDPHFRGDIEQMDRVLQTLSKPPEWSLLDELLKPASSSRIGEVEVAQPACAAIQMATFNKLKRLGLMPWAVIGHSSGEIAAAYAAGHISMECAMTIAYYRGYVSGQPSCVGAMAAIGMGPASLRHYLEDGVVIACYNSPSSCTISGDRPRVETTLHNLREQEPEVLYKLLNTRAAYHSPHMDVVASEYLQLLQVDTAKFGQPQDKIDTGVKCYSSVTCGLVNDEMSSPSYWVHNLRMPVQLSDAVGVMLRARDSVLVEIGPHSTLSGSLKEICRHLFRPWLYTSTMSRGSDSAVDFLGCVGNLYQHGVSLDLRPLFVGGRAVTGLPCYPWDRVSLDSPENRLDRSWRARPWPRHCLLGSRISEGGDDHPQWRNTLDLRAESWLADHKIQGQATFPAAAFVSMAGEAFRQMENMSMESGYRIRRLVISTGLFLSTNSPKDMLTSLRRHRTDDLATSKRWDFAISSFDGNSWTEHCVGIVGPRSDRTTSKSRELLPPLHRDLDRGRLYKEFDALGYGYDGTFRGLSNVRCSTTERVAAAHVRLNADNSNGSAFTLHPVYIDSCIQLMLVAMVKGLFRHMQLPFVPTVFEEIEVRSTRRDGISGHARSNSPGSNCTEFADGDVIVFRAREVRFSSPSIYQRPTLRQTYPLMEMLYLPFFDFVDKAELIHPVAHVSQGWSLVDEVAFLYLVKASRTIANMPTVLPHILKYQAWAEREIKDAKGALSSLAALSDLELDSRFQDAAATIAALPNASLHGPSKAIPCGLPIFHENAEDFFSGRRDMWEVCRELGVLDKAYGNPGVECLNYIRLLAHAKPGMRILEVGAGTAALTFRILESLQVNEGFPMYFSYTFSDISPMFFLAAKERLASFANVEFRQLDIGIDPTTQGFEAEGYDLIFAGHVLHATPSLSQSLRHIHKLLGKDGTLILQELNRPPRSVVCMFACFPSWWAGEDDNRLHGPCVSVPRWDAELRDAGFNGAEMVVHDDPDPEVQRKMIIVSRKVEEGGPAGDEELAKITILHRGRNGNPSEAVQQLASQLNALQFAVSYCGLGDAASDGQIVISCLDLEGDPFFERMDERDLDAFQAFARGLGPRKLLWLSRPSQLRCQSPGLAMGPAVVRVFRGELGSDVYTLELDADEPCFANACAQVIGRMHERQPSPSHLEPDRDFVVHGGRVCVGREYPSYPSRERPMDSLENQEYGSKLVQRRLGDLDSIAWREHPLPRTVPRGHVEVETATVGCGFRDYSILSGLVRDEGQSLAIGFEMAGRVHRVGPDVEGLTIGDRVVMFSLAGADTHAIVPQGNVVKIADSMTFEEAASIPVAFITAVWALVEEGHLCGSNTVLIHSACGATGLAAIQVAQMLGAKIFATVGNRDKVSHLVSEYGIPEDHIFSSRDASFADRVMDMTDGRGVDLVLNSLGGELFDAAWDCVAEFGRLIQLGKRDQAHHAQLDMSGFLGNRVYCAFDVIALCRRRPGEAMRILGKAFEYIGRGLLRPIKPITAFNARDLKEAMTLMSTGRHIGKIVANFQTSEPSRALDPEARDERLVCLAVWLAERGARTLVLLSRRAGLGGDSGSLIEELGSMGCAITMVRGSVTNMQDVEKAIQASPCQIKGVFHLASVERDRSFLDIEFADWTAVVEPKVKGAWNLHLAFRNHALDLFWVASSAATLWSQHGQSGYRAANSFVEALCLDRASLGLPATALAISAINDAGLIAEDDKKLHSTLMMGFTLSRTREFLESVESSIVRSSHRLQTVTQPTVEWTHGDRGFWECASAQNRFLMTASPTPGRQATTIYRDPRIWLLLAQEGDQHREQKVAEAVESQELQDLLKNMRGADALETLADPNTVNVICHAFKARINEMMFRGDSALGNDSMLYQLGVDSLVSIELRKWIKAVFRVDPKLMEINAHMTVQQLSETVIAKLRETAAREAGRES
ncbi:hypothetical protein HIM_00818 [Hirsutella minnesotensis 3608]|nr:hypothetical protein HIM_00818 [Hirsutella minnesotensis 3608]